MWHTTISPGNNCSRINKMNIKKLIHSFRYAFEGLKLAVSVDQNVRFHIIVGLLVIPIAILLKVSSFEFIFIIFSIFFVLITEMMNTAVEEMTNLIIKEHREEARIAKDVAAAAVLLSAVFALIVGIIILIPRLLAIL